MWDILFSAVLAVFALSAVWVWWKLYQWIVEPAKHHRPPSGSFPPNPHFTQHG
jgi:hypothetical protein